MVKQNKDIQSIEKAAELTATFLVPFILALFFYIAPVAVHSAMPSNSSILNNATKYTENQYHQYTIFFENLFNNFFFIIGIISVVLTWFFLAIYYLLGRQHLLLKVLLWFEMLLNPVKCADTKTPIDDYCRK